MLKMIARHNGKLKKRRPPLLIYLSCEARYVYLIIKKRYVYLAQFNWVKAKEVS